MRNVNMAIEIKVPTLPESVTDATVAKWYCKVGDTIERDQNLVDLETDKVMLEVPAPSAGVILELKVNEGDTVNAEQVLAVLEERAKLEKSVAPEKEEKPQPTEKSASYKEPGPSARRAAAEQN